MSYGQNNNNNDNNDFGRSGTNPTQRGIHDSNPSAAGFGSNTAAQQGSLGGNQSGGAYGQSETGFDQSTGGGYGGSGATGTGMGTGAGYGQSATGAGYGQTTTGGGLGGSQTASYGHPGDHFSSDNSSYGKTSGIGNTDDTYGSTHTGTGAFGGSTDHDVRTGTHGGKPGLTDKLRGEAEKMAGKVSGNPNLANRGAERASGDLNQPGSGY